jgi:peptidylprolyl isomerase
VRLAGAVLALGAGALVPAATSAAASVRSVHHTAAASLPSVTGGFNIRPTLHFPSGPAPKGLVAKVIHQGKGPVVKAHDLLVCNYYAQIWKGKVFDTSFGRGLFGTPIGVGAVIKGWDLGLVGKRVGSEVLLSIPPVDGYGKTGNPSAGIKGTSTLEFVIDIVGVYNKGVHGDPHAKVLHREVNGIKIGGKPGGVPIVTVTKKAPQPKSPTVTLLDRGQGRKITPGLIVDQYVVGTWSGPKQPSTWATGTPDSQTIGNSASPDLLDKTIGMPLGSRVLVEIPKSSTGGPYALVVDLVAEPHDPKAAA